MGTASEILLSEIPVSFATVSVGCRQIDTLPKKIDAIANAGFGGIELGFPDLVNFASEHMRHKVGEYDYDELCTAARVVRAMCEAKKLKIMLLQPFANFEGWPDGSDERKDAFTRLNGWISIMKASGCDTLQVGSTDSPASKIRTDRETIVQDLRELADLLEANKLRVAYENWCWSTHAPGWKDVYEIVRQVDRPNVGLCLDTFQSAGGEWGDPTSPNGMLDGRSKEDVHAGFERSMASLAATVPASMIYVLQISDAYLPPEPFSKEEDKSGLRPRGRWSHDFRPVPFKGYLPVVEVARAVLQTGFRGYFSYEVFDSGPEGKGRDYEMSDFLAEAQQSHRKLLEKCAHS